ncbi:hypothetical protein R1sor_025259 [Riccia sorocarpa]|uniref:Uncharacterized protein n=1 Tax=Riccia sorocarpa TaxID=122646 RepID=A0ABD3GBT0_9MARC
MEHRDGDTAGIEIRSGAGDTQDLNRIIMRQSQEGGILIRSDKEEPSESGSQQRRAADLRVEQVPQKPDLLSTYRNNGSPTAAAHQGENPQQGISEQSGLWRSTFTNLSYKPEGNPDPNSPRRAPQQPPGTPSAAAPSSGIIPSGIAHDPIDNGDTTTSPGVHTTAAVLQQLDSTEPRIHTTASVWEQLQSPGQEDTGGDDPDTTTDKKKEKVTVT